MLDVTYIRIISMPSLDWSVTSSNALIGIFLFWINSFILMKIRMINANAFSTIDNNLGSKNISINIWINHPIQNTCSKISCKSLYSCSTVGRGVMPGRWEVRGSNPLRPCRISLSEFSLIFSESHINSG